MYTGYFFFSPSHFYLPGVYPGTLHPLGRDFSQRKIGGFYVLCFCSHCILQWYFVSGLQQYVDILRYTSKYVRKKKNFEGRMVGDSQWLTITSHFECSVPGVVRELYPFLKELRGYSQVQTILSILVTGTSSTFKRASIWGPSTREHASNEYPGTRCFTHGNPGDGDFFSPRPPSPVQYLVQNLQETLKKWLNSMSTPSTKHLSHNTEVYSELCLTADRYGAMITQQQSSSSSSHGHGSSPTDSEGETSPKYVGATPTLNVPQAIAGARQDNSSSNNSSSRSSSSSSSSSSIDFCMINVDRFRKVDPGGRFHPFPFSCSLWYVLTAWEAWLSDAAWRATRITRIEFALYLTIMADPSALNTHTCFSHIPVIYGV